MGADKKSGKSSSKAAGGDKKRRTIQFDEKQVAAVQHDASKTFEEKRKQLNSTEGSEFRKSLKAKPSD